MWYDFCISSSNYFIVALERDNVLKNTDDIGLLAIRKPKSDEFLPGVMYKNKLMNPDEPFIPDEFIVKVSASEIISIINFRLLHLLH